MGNKPWFGCENCPLKGQTQSVPPNLLRGCDLLVVGESPGRQEVLRGEPFIGPSGILLRKAIQIAKGSSLKISFTNAVLCRPLAGAAEGEEKIPATTVNCCNQRLLQEIEIEDPKVILALGNVAMRALGYPETRITLAHGISRRWNNTYLVPCIHPAAVLRHGAQYPVFQSVIGKAVQLAYEMPPPDPGETEYDVIDSEECFQKHLRKLARLPPGQLLGCDIETNGLDPFTKKIVALGICPEKNYTVIFPEKYLRRTELADFFKHSKARFLWHNGKFDVRFLRVNGIPARVDEDSLLSHYCLCEIQGTHDLEQLAGVFLGARDYKTEVDRFRKKGWDECPKETLHKYLAQDCDYTLQLYEVLMPKVRSQPGLENAYRKVLLPASELLAQVELNGMWVNPETLAEVKAELARQVDESEEAFYRAIEASWPESPAGKAGRPCRTITPELVKRMRAFLERGVQASEEDFGEALQITWRETRPHEPCPATNVRSGAQIKKLVKDLGGGTIKNTKSETLEGLRHLFFVRRVLEHRRALDLQKAYEKALAQAINPQSSPQLKALIYTDMGFKVPRRYPKNTEESTLKAMPSHPVIEAILDYRGKIKAYSTYAKGIDHAINPFNGRVHSTFSLFSTVTGRLSSKEPNVQNIPKESIVRTMFQAPPGKWLLECDLQQAELRVAALLSKDEALLQIFREGRKLHHEVAEKLFGPGYDAHQYRMGKSLNFGVIYGAGASHISKSFEISMEVAQEMINMWYETFPDLGAWLQDRRAAPREGRVLQSPTGRKRRVGVLTNDNLDHLENISANFEIQATASDIALLGAVRSNSFIKSLGGKIICLVHDSIVCEIPPCRKVAEQVRDCLFFHFRKVGEELLGNAIPILSDAQIGTRWGALVEFDQWNWNAGNPE